MRVNSVSSTSAASPNKTPHSTFIAEWIQTRARIAEAHPSVQRYRKIQSDAAPSFCSTWFKIWMTAYVETTHEHTGRSGLRVGREPMQLICTWKGHVYLKCCTVLQSGEWLIIKCSYTLSFSVALWLPNCIHIASSITSALEYAE